jgi:hypothetical protein
MLIMNKTNESTNQLISLLLDKVYIPRIMNMRLRVLQCAVRAEVTTSPRLQRLFTPELARGFLR